MDFSAKLTLPYLLPNQADKHVTFNESLRRLDTIVQLSVVSAAVSVPPGGPVGGDRYLVPENAVDDWAGRDGQVASYQDGGWQYFEPQNGWTAWDEATARLVAYDGVEWVEAGGSGGVSEPDRFGINTSADDTNRLAVASSASLFNHDGAGHQMKLNKASATETASLLFQSSWQGHAEIGLVGRNDLDIKVSADGLDFSSAIYVRAEDQAVGIGLDTPTAKLQVGGAIRLAEVTMAELPSAAETGPGALIFVSDYASISTLVFSDGTSWRLARTNAVIVRN